MLYTSNFGQLMLLVFNFKQLSFIFDNFCVIKLKCWQNNNSCLNMLTWQLIFLI